MMSTPKRVYLLIAPLCLERQVLPPRHPPIFAAYCVGGLKAAGHEVLVRDLYHRVKPLAEVLAEAVQFQPDLIVLAAEDLDRKAPISESHKLARALKQELPQVPIGLMGSSSEAHFSKALADNDTIDFAWLGEADEAIGAWLAASPQERPTLPGVLSRDADGSIRAHGIAAPRDLSRLPWPDWEAVHFRDYRQAPHRRRGDLSYIIVTSRGCPFRCTFCEELTYFTSVPHRQRSIDDVLAEMRWAMQQYPGLEFSFQDPVFGLKEEWAVEFCERLRAELPGAVWGAITRVDIVSERLLQAMARAGCYNILVGLESANESTLRSLKKFNVNERSAREFIRIAHANGIEVTASFMLGLPHETRDDFRRTVDYAIDLDPDYAQFIVHKHFEGKRPFEGLGTYEEQWDFTAQDMLGPVFVSNAYRDVEEMRREQWLAYRRFYLRWRFVARRWRDLIRPKQWGRYYEALPILASMAQRALPTISPANSEPARASGTRDVPRPSPTGEDSRESI